MSSYRTLQGGPYAGMKRKLTRLPTFTFSAKGMTGYYNRTGVWVAVTSPKQLS